MFRSAAPLPQLASPFFSLPAELRNIIYTYALQVTGSIGLPRPMRDKSTALLRTCQKAYAERVGMMYNANFQFANVLALRSFLERIGSNTRFLSCIEVGDYFMGEGFGVMRRVPLCLTTAAYLEDLVLIPIGKIRLSTMKQRAKSWALVLGEKSEDMMKLLKMLSIRWNVLFYRPPENERWNVRFVDQGIDVTTGQRGTIEKCPKK